MACTRNAKQDILLPGLYFGLLRRFYVRYILSEIDGYILLSDNLFLVTDFLDCPPTRAREFIAQCTCPAPHLMLLAV
jgi:hypothetical protein